MAYLESRGIIHRDLAARNVLGMYCLLAECVINSELLVVLVNLIFIIYCYTKGARSDVDEYACGRITATHSLLRLTS